MRAQLFGWASSRARAPAKEETVVRFKTIEKTIAQLDEQRRAINAKMNTSDAKEALKLHNELAAITKPLADAEERWVELSEELEGAD